MDNRHLCLSFRGSGDGCERCPIKSKGHCESFLTLLEKKGIFLNSKYYFSEHDRQDILSDFVLRTQSSVDSFEGRRGAQFRTWANRIFQNTWSDFFRKSKKTEDIQDNIPVYENTESGTEFKNIIEVLLRLIKEDVTGCCKLFTDYYKWLKEGLTQKQMANHYDIQENSFTQRLRRCRSVVKTLLGEV